jgi:hypothetical protein
LKANTDARPELCRTAKATPSGIERDVSGI